MGVYTFDMRNFRYSKLTIFLKKFYRNFHPIQRSQYTKGNVEDICAINLVPRSVIKKFFTKSVERLRKLKGHNIGDYLEFGVFNGSSLGSMYKVIKEQQLSTRIFGFDAFEGLPEGSEKEDGGVWKKGFYTCSFEQTERCLRERGVDLDSINWCKGWYKNTLNDDLVREKKIYNIGIVFIDCDTYSSSKTALDFLAPLITSPAIFCFDDWKLNDLDVKEMGEYKSFNEFLDANTHLKAAEIKSYNRKSKSFLICPVDNNNPNGAKRML
jgi:hypothetical protein